MSWPSLAIKAGENKVGQYTLPSAYVAYEELTIKAVRAHLLLLAGTAA